MAVAELIFDGKHGVGESPVRRADEASLYWVDIPAKSDPVLNNVQRRGTRLVVAGMAGCIAHIDGPRWLAAMESGVFMATLADDGSVNTELLVAAHAEPGMRFNDGRCDRQGRFLAGTMFLDMAAAKAVGVVSSFDANGNQQKIPR